MIGRTNVGGGGVIAAWAYIGVTYPSGSVCTATNGTITLTADGTSGLYVFGIPEPTSTPEMWTVSCTNGTKSKTAMVSIGTKYQFETVTLRYSRLPDGYQEVEYLESSGEQYIDLAPYFYNFMNLEFNIVYMALAGQNRSVCGNGNTGSSSLYIGRANYSGNIDYYFIETRIASNASLNQKVTAVVNNDNNQIIENEVNIGTITSSIAGQGKIGLFHAYSSAATNARIYSFALRDKTEDTLLYNFVPCYRTSDDEAGFYDLANNTFVGNNGTGAFVVGSDV